MSLETTRPTFKKDIREAQEPGLKEHLELLAMTAVKVTKAKRVF